MAGQLLGLRPADAVRVAAVRSRLAAEGNFIHTDVSNWYGSEHETSAARSGVVSGNGIASSSATSSNGAGGGGGEK